MAEPSPARAPDAADGPGRSGADAGLARRLGLFDVTMLVMGSVIGVGIFMVPRDVAALVGTPALVLAAWIVGGAVTLTGSLVYAELAQRRPLVGGQYAFLREAYHPLVAFLYGWSLLWIVQSGGMASVAVVFGRYALELVQTTTPFNPAASWASGAAAEAIVAAAAIAVLTAINCLGVRAGSTAQNLFMLLKILAIGGLIACGLLLATSRGPDAGISGASGQPATGAPEATTGDFGLMAFAAALVPVLFAYGGSHTTTFMAGEIRQPRRNLPWGLVLGVWGVVGLYLGVNAACLRVLGVRELAHSGSPAADVMRAVLGPAGAMLLSAGIAVSAIGFLSQATLTSPRVYYAMARDGLFFRGIAWVHPRSRAPVVAILLQGLFAMVIAVSGTFHQILNYVMSVEMVFYSLTAISLFLIRKQDAVAGKRLGFSRLGHPMTTLVFAAANLALVVNLFLKYPGNSATGLGIGLAGIPVYFCWRYSAKGKGI